MNLIKNQTFDEERALYGSCDAAKSRVVYGIFR